MKNRILASALKPPSKLAVEHYRVLSNLEHLIASRPETFWCYTHLADLPLSEQSPDPRFCKACNAVLTRDREDSRASGTFRRPWWVPQNGKRKVKDDMSAEIQGPQAMSAQKGTIPISESSTPIPNKAEEKNSENGIIRHSPCETLKKRLVKRPSTRA